MRALALLSSITLTAAVAAGGCGKLDNVTEVKDLRVLAVRSDPAGFLVDLDDPGNVPQDMLNATVTALVVDPKGEGQTLTFSAKGCPDYLDTITAATGQSSKICPDPGTASNVPPPLAPLLETHVVYPPDNPQTQAPEPDPNTIEYHPSLTFGLTTGQVKAFFTPPPTGMPAIDQTLAYNRDFGLDAIVNLTFNLGSEKAEAIKRVVYWPRLAADQQPNQNPTMDELQLYKHRNATTGDPEDPWTDPEPTLSIAAGDKLYVLPVPTPGAAEPYLLREKNVDTNMVETKMIARELLTYSFFSSGGTFAPAVRQSELSPIFTSVDGRVHIDSQMVLPAAADVVSFGRVHIWVVVRDERAGASWLQRTINLQP